MQEKQWTRRQILAAAGSGGLVALGARPRLDAAALSDYERKVLAKKPVAYWRLGETRGPAAMDSTGNGHNGVYHGTPIFGERGAIDADANTAIKLNV